jgi:hypothetical protein
MAPQTKTGLDLTKPIGTKPGRRDVVAFRGGLTNHHGGSKEWRALVDERKLEYMYARSQKAKRAIVEECMQEHKARGGRYVGEWEGQLYEATYKKAYDKTIQRLRERNKQFLRQLFPDDAAFQTGPATFEDGEELRKLMFGPADLLTMSDNSDDPSSDGELTSYEGSSSEDDCSSSDDEMPSSWCNDLDEFLSFHLVD